MSQNLRALVDVREGIAVRVVSDSMEPAYEQGDLILEHPARVPRRGEDVFLVRVLNAETAALVKRLVNWTAEIWRARQYNPPQGYELPRREWPQAMPIVGKCRRR